MCSITRRSYIWFLEKINPRSAAIGFTLLNFFYHNRPHTDMQNKKQEGQQGL